MARAAGACVATASPCTGVGRVQVEGLGRVQVEGAARRRVIYYRKKTSTASRLVGYPWARVFHSSAMS